MFIALEHIFEIIFNFKIISFAIICTILWYLHYKQNKRILEFARLLDGPKTIPVIGNAHLFLGDSRHFFKQYLNIFTKWESPARIWLVNHLYITIKKPADLEVVLTKCLNKDPEMYRHVTPTLGTGLFSNPSVTDWKRHRKIIMPTFNQKILNGFLKIFNDQSLLLVNHLKKEVNQGSFDVYSYLSHSTMSNICETAMSVKGSEKQEHLLFTNSFGRVLEIVSMRMFNIFYGIDFFYQFTSLAKEERSKVNFMRTFTQKIINQKRQNLHNVEDNNEEKSRKVFLDYLIESNCFTDKELTDEVLTMVLAGNHTVAASLSFMLMLLGMYPDIQNKVYEEISQNFEDSSRPIEVEDLHQLPYLEMVIKETLRIFPVAGVLVREVENDLKIGDLIVPKGCSCMMNIWATHHDPTIWPEPEKFDPERFQPEEISKRHPYAWIPFGGGPRNCSGIKFAMMALKTYSANILRRYKIMKPNYKMGDIELSLQVVFRPVNGFIVALALRK